MMEANSVTMENGMGLQLNIERQLSNNLSSTESPQVSISVKIEFQESYSMFVVHVYSGTSYTALLITCDADHVRSVA